MNLYSIVISDRADADIERILNRQVMISVKSAASWQVLLESALNSLTSLPSRCPKAHDGSYFPSVIARQLYFGKYRVVFHVIEADADEEEGTVVVLRVLHGAQPMGQQPQDMD